MGALKTKRINLAHRMHEDPVRDAIQRRRLHLVLPLLFIMLAVIAVEIVFLFVLQPRVQAEKDSLAEILNSAELMEQYARAQQLQQDEVQVGARHTALAGLVENMQSYPDFGSRIYKSYTESAAKTGAMVTSVYFGRDGGTLILSGIGATATTAAQYAAELRELPDVMALTYTGYEAQNTGKQLVMDPETGEMTTPDSIYVFTITCILAGGEVAG